MFGDLCHAKPLFWGHVYIWQARGLMVLDMTIDSWRASCREEVHRLSCCWAPSRCFLLSYGLVSLAGNGTSQWLCLHTHAYVTCRGQNHESPWIAQVLFQPCYESAGLLDESGNHSQFVAISLTDPGLAWLGSCCIDVLQPGSWTQLQSWVGAKRASLRKPRRREGAGPVEFKGMIWCESPTAWFCSMIVMCILLFVFCLMFLCMSCVLLSLHGYIWLLVSLFVCWVIWPTSSCKRIIEALGVAILVRASFCHRIHPI